MAHMTAPMNAAHGHEKRAGLGTRFLDFLVAIAEANPRMREIERLNAKSDEDLAKLGLKRDEIVQHVMRDVLYI